MNATTRKHAVHGEPSVVARSAEWPGEGHDRRPATLCRLRRDKLVEPYTGRRKGPLRESMTFCSIASPSFIVPCTDPPNRMAAVGVDGWEMCGGVLARAH